MQLSFSYKERLFFVSLRILPKISTKSEYYVTYINAAYDVWVVNLDYPLVLWRCKPQMEFCLNISIEMHCIFFNSYFFHLYIALYEIFKVYIKVDLYYLFLLWL